ncbi:hypothetical protein ACLI4U_08115 [Natrialbaceae archaeon A-CW2]|uniref:hypothetical protein n=1 Tax=Natronosalvus amylolyticus TaxID=2961994 RepID=UPI0020CA1350|nr:hypothetical protein [Natronosalvus amylolyticus]
MPSIRNLLSSLLLIVIGIVAMVVLATVVFFVTIFVVSTGSSLAGYDPSADFVVLSSALIVVAVILTGGFTPRLSGSEPAEDEPFDDRTYR